jgi:hypothetical protein
MDLNRPSWFETSEVVLYLGKGMPSFWAISCRRFLYDNDGTYKRRRIDQINITKLLDSKEGEPWRSGKAVALWPWGHGSKPWKQPLAEMQGNAAHIRPKMARPFPGPYASRSYVHRAALLLDSKNYWIWSMEVDALWLGTMKSLLQKDQGGLCIQDVHILPPSLFYCCFELISNNNNNKRKGKYGIKFKRPNCNLVLMNHASDGLWKRIQ